MRKIAIIISHPIQYYAPWFHYLNEQSGYSIRVFYLWDFGVWQHTDRDFQQTIQWDIPLLSGYDYEFVPNVSVQPGTHHFWGLQNPSLITQVKQFDPDAVLLMNYNYASLYHFLWHWRQTPLLFRGDSHRLWGGSSVKAWIKKQWITQLYRRFAACLYVGQANYRYFRIHGMESDRLFFSPHAVDNERFLTQAIAAQVAAQQWKQELGIPSDHAVILFAGKFIPKKRPLDLLNAFLQADLANTSLLFVGGGELESSLRQRASQHAHVYFAPFQNQTFMPRTYAIADLFVLPSYGPAETWGLAVNEAMCLGKPLIVSDHVGCAADLVHPNRNGFVFPAGQVSALADCLTSALSDRDRLKTWGEYSLYLVKKYSYYHATQGLQKAISSLEYQSPLLYSRATSL
jgi:glycosyltransferase involved in cell wall biosynthesis